MDNGSRLAGGNPPRGRASNDFYPTHPDSINALLAVEKIIYPALEPACGDGAISKLLKGDVVSSDIVDRGYGEVVDFLKGTYGGSQFSTVITNPPFKYFQEFVEEALFVASEKVIMFGKLQALEGMKRATYLEKTPLRCVYVFKKRQQLWRNGEEFDPLTGKKWASSTMAFAWYVWEINYTGDPTIKWL